MKILLHICCAPCTVYPVENLSASGNQVRGFFYNPNIHPYQEFARRVAALEAAGITVVKNIGELGAIAKQAMGF